MSKTSKKWIKLDWDDPDALKSQHIQYSETQSISQKIDILDSELEHDVQKYAGFENRTDSTIAMVGNDFTISTGGGYNVWIEGVGEKTITDPLSIEITEDQKDTYVYFDWHNNAVRINKSVSVWNLRSGAAIPVAIVAKDGAEYATTDERHAYNRNRIWHYWNHLNIGATWLSGLVGTFDNTTISVTQGVLHDEDISFDSGETKTTTTLWYRNATDGMRFVRNSSRPYSYVGDEINWDNGSGTLQNVGNNNYYCSWVYGSHDEDEPIYTVIGQGNHANLNAARAEGKPLINKFTAEWKLLYKVIYRNTTTPTWIETLDFRAVQMGVPTTVSPPNSHSQLIHRDAEGSHPAEAISVDATGFTGNLDVTDDDVQKVADKLDALSVSSPTSDITTATVMPILGGNYLAPNIDVFVLAGQSNAAGYQTDATTLDQEFEGFDDVFHDCLFWYDSHRTNGAIETSGNKFVGLRPKADNTCGPELALGRKLANNQQPVALVQVARYGGANGQSTLADDGAATGNTWNTNRTGEYYDLLISNVDGALAELRNLGYAPRVRGLFWVHGETDSSSQDWADAYESNLNSLLTSFRNEYGKGIRAVINRCRNDRTTDVTTDPHATVRTALESVGLSPGNALVSVDDFRLDGSLVDGSHYSTMETAVFGQRLYFAYDSLNNRQFPVRNQYWHATTTNLLLQTRYPTATDWRLYHHDTGELVTLKDYQGTGIIGGVSTNPSSDMGFDKYTNGVVYAYQTSSHALSTTANAFRFVNSNMSRFFDVSNIRMASLSGVEFATGHWDDSPKVPMETRLMLHIQGGGWIIQKIGYTNSEISPNVTGSYKTQATKFFAPITSVADDWHDQGIWAPTDSFVVEPTGGTPAFVDSSAIVDGFGFHIFSTLGSITRLGSICFHGNLPITSEDNNLNADAIDGLLAVTESEFINSDLTDNILKINSSDTLLALIDNNGDRRFPDNINYGSVWCEINLASFTPITGTWRLRKIG